MEKLSGRSKPARVLVCCHAPAKLLIAICCLGVARHQPGMRSGVAYAWLHCQGAAQFQAAVRHCPFWAPRGAVHLDCADQADCMQSSKPEKGGQGTIKGSTASASQTPAPSPSTPAKAPLTPISAQVHGRLHPQHRHGSCGSAQTGFAGPNSGNGPGSNDGKGSGRRARRNARRAAADMRTACVFDAD